MFISFAMQATGISSFDKLFNHKNPYVTDDPLC